MCQCMQLEQYIRHANMCLRGKAIKLNEKFVFTAWRDFVICMSIVFNSASLHNCFDCSPARQWIACKCVRVKTAKKFISCRLKCQLFLCYEFVKQRHQRKHPAESCVYVILKLKCMFFLIRFFFVSSVLMTHILCFCIFMYLFRFILIFFSSYLFTLFCSLSISFAFAVSFKCVWRKHFTLCWYRYQKIGKHQLF